MIKMIRADEFADMMLDLERIADASIESLFALGCAQHDITMNQMRILIELYKVGNCTVGELSNTLGIMRGNMAATCKKLEESQLLTRVRSKQDERIVYMQLTLKGKELADSILQQIQIKYSDTFESVDSNEIEKILTGLKALYALLERM